MSHSFIHPNTDSILRAKGLRNQVGDLITTATVTLESFVDRNGVAVSGVSVPVSLSYNAVTLAYEAVIPRGIGVAIDRKYFATVRADYLGIRRDWVEPVICQKSEA